MEGRVMQYSSNLVMSIGVKDYVSSFRKLQIPTLLISGADDEMLQADFLPMLAQWHLAPQLDKEVHVIPKMRHMTITNAASRILPGWIAQRWCQPEASEQQPAVQQQSAAMAVGE